MLTSLWRCARWPGRRARVWRRCLNNVDSAKRRTRARADADPGSVFHPVDFGALRDPAAEDRTPAAAGTASRPHSTWLAGRRSFRNCPVQAPIPRRRADVILRPATEKEPDMLNRSSVTLTRPPPGCAGCGNSPRREADDERDL